MIQGEQITGVLEQFEHAEWLADVDTARTAGTNAALPRTAGQRRFDALVALCVAAASATLDGKAPEPLVNIFADHTTTEHHLARACGTHVEPLDPATVAERRCHTAHGNPVDPTDLVAALLLGQIRRVMLDHTGVVIDLGRRSRLFTGNARDALNLADRTNGAPLCGHHNRLKNHGYTTRRDTNGHWHTHHNTS